MRTIILLSVLGLVACDGKRGADSSGDVATAIQPSIDAADKTVREVGAASVIVNYDDSGEIWLTGSSAHERRAMRTMQELSGALKKIDHKGAALITHVVDAGDGPGQGSLLGPMPPRNERLEGEILRVLRDSGFSIPSE